MDSHLPQKRIKASLLLPARGGGGGGGGGGVCNNACERGQSILIIFTYLLLDYEKRIHIFILLYHVEKN